MRSGAQASFEVLSPVGPLTQSQFNRAPRCPAFNVCACAPVSLHLFDALRLEIAAEFEPAAPYEACFSITDPGFGSPSAREAPQRR